MQAIHTVVTESGRFFQMRGSTEDEIRQILFVARANVHENVLDVIDEVRGEKDLELVEELEEEDDEEDEETPAIETKFLKRGMDLVEIPQDIEKMKLMGIRVDVLASRFKELVGDVEDVDVEEEKSESVEVPLIEEKPEEVEAEAEELMEMDIRPLQDIKVIVGVAETSDHSSLFDE